MCKGILVWGGAGGPQVIFVDSMNRNFSKGPNPRNSLTEGGAEECKAVTKKFFYKGGPIAVLNGQGGPGLKAEAKHSLGHPRNRGGVFIFVFLGGGKEGPGGFPGFFPQPP